MCDCGNVLNEQSAFMCSFINEMSGVWDLVASNSEVADCNQLNTPPLPFQACRRAYNHLQIGKNVTALLYRQFGFILGYCRNIADC